jgi:predicted transcriptional regulator
MTDTTKLKQKVSDSGLKASFIAKKLNVSRSGWYRKLNGKSKFTAEQIQTMCEILHITSLREKEDIFFATM